MKNLTDAIVLLSNFCSATLCDKLLDEYINSDEWEVSQATNYAEKVYRNCQSIGISKGNTIRKNPKNRSKLDLEILEVMRSAFKTYKIKFPHCNVCTDLGYDLLQYKTDQFYKEHTDSYIRELRTVACSIALNDDYTGGEFGFFDNELKYDLKKGDVLLFPANFLYPHQINVVTSGVRYSIVTWAN